MCFLFYLDVLRINNELFEIHNLAAKELASQLAWMFCHGVNLLLKFSPPMQRPIRLNLLTFLLTDSLVFVYN